MSNPAPTPGLTAGRVNGEKNTLGAMLSSQHRSQTFGAGPVMGFSGKTAKSEFRPRWESEVGNLGAGLYGVPTRRTLTLPGFLAICAICAIWPYIAHIAQISRVQSI